MNEERIGIHKEDALALGGLVLLVAADLAITAMTLLAGFRPALAGPAAVVALLAILAYRGIRWARLLLVAMAVLRLIVVAGWLPDVMAGRQFTGMMLVLGFAAAYGFAVYALGISRKGRAFFERRRAERISGRQVSSA